MNVGELKEAFKPLIESLVQSDCPNGVIDLTELQIALRNEENNSELPENLVRNLQQLIKDFWQAATQTLPPQEWETSELAQPWLALAKALSLPPDYHHQICYAELASRFDPKKKLPFSLQEFMNLLISTGRVTGYKKAFGDEKYPLEKIRDLKDKLRLQTSITGLSVLFYLSHHFITETQSDLLPCLSHYRSKTTDEERRSEKAILHFLSTETLQRLCWFEDVKDFIEGREMLNNPHIKALAPVLPSGKIALLRALDARIWHYSVKGQYQLDPSKDALLSVTVEALNQHFSWQTTKVSKALDSDSSITRKTFDTLAMFIEQTGAQVTLFPLKDKTLFFRALKVFCLQQYDELRASEGNRHSLFGFSIETKRAATRKKIWQLLTQQPDPMSFLQILAGKQGRLGEIENKIRQLETSSTMTI
ncbi:hypothetical protein [Legionella spiritensis]|uniref:hypothetical protein n=1 Tax=Legionella spiritensis TaxID=452 RepID=UPI000F701DAD|nr:hypothetical protein [Legionella spiritensis]VEG91662.1 Uncharacterised protein [Legionella spiritensis]